MISYNLRISSNEEIFLRDILDIYGKWYNFFRDTKIYNWIAQVEKILRVANPWALGPSKKVRDHIS